MAFRFFGDWSGMIAPITTLADELVPDELWALVAPLLPVLPRPPYGGRHRAIPIAAIVYMARMSLRSGCRPPVNWAVAHLRPAGAAWRSGTPLGVFRPTAPSRSWIGWAGGVRWTGRGQRGHHERTGQTRGPRGRPGASLDLLLDRLVRPTTPYTRPTTTCHRWHGNSGSVMPTRYRQPWPHGGGARPAGEVHSMLGMHMCR